MPPPRNDLGLPSPIAQRIASSRFDLPQPLGPTTPVSPGSMRSSAGSTKLLKPASLSFRISIAGYAAWLRLPRSGVLQRGFDLRPGRLHRRQLDHAPVQQEGWRAVHFVLVRLVLHAFGERLHRREVRQALLRLLRADPARGEEL